MKVPITVDGTECFVPAILAEKIQILRTNRAFVETHMNLNNITLLSPRELEIFEQLGHPITTKELADLPGKKCSIKTIETHIEHIAQKLNAKGILQVRYMAFTWMQYKKENTRVKLIPAREQNYELVLEEP